MKRLLMVLILCMVSYAHGATDLIHWDELVERYEQDRNERLFEYGKVQLVHYYTTMYEYEVEQICKHAWEYFTALEYKKDNVIVFDIDDTALYGYHYQDSLAFIWQQQSWLMEARANNIAYAIEPVLALYQHLIGSGFTLIFISARADSAYAETANELKAVGYTYFKHLILMPVKQARTKTPDSIAAWKLSVRKKLAKQYRIIGCVADRAVDFYGGYTGFEVRVPNYLY